MGNPTKAVTYLKDFSTDGKQLQAIAYARLGDAYADLNKQDEFVKPDEWIDMVDEPDHQELCNREQRAFLKAIREDEDMTEHARGAIDSLRIVLAADESIRTHQVVEL